MSQLTGSKWVSNAFEKFSRSSELNNHVEIASWFKQSNMSIIYSEDYSESVVRHWGKQVIKKLMESHCNTISYSNRDDYIKTYPIKSCNAFKQGMVIKFVDGVEILRDGLNAYNSFREKCEKAETVLLQDMKKVALAEVKCLDKINEYLPYLKLQQQKLLKLN
ncbi:hypothetical protein [Agaribacter marinus]|uniref:Uncharacterized protein n=1 Tax=Agaribacter marinus TaxID=1431249 RepID=A0AA37SYE4_9ALTE|nr:hypothetical protein [Agaribacter marinus]GLR70425.1 hypothetical protein GCM10007852_13330 [Agaribacter marinus]